MVFTSDQTSRNWRSSTPHQQDQDLVPLPPVGYGTSPTPDAVFCWSRCRRRSTRGGRSGRTKVSAHGRCSEDPVKVPARPDGKVAYVSCSKAKQVAVVDLSQWEVDSLIDAGKGVDGLAWAAPATGGRTPIASRPLDGGQANERAARCRLMRSRMLNRGVSSHHAEPGNLSPTQSLVRMRAQGTRNLHRLRATVG